jgi:adenine-specific DNA-methyltransferase
MDSKTLDIVAENVSKLKGLFPEAFTEGKVDFDALKEVLGEYVDGRDERYSFTWNGKSKARMLAQTPSTGTLRPCKDESVDWDSTQNLFIEGDNLEVLKLLQKSYHKKVKMIYIDPPYNTGNDFVYKDHFRDNIKNYKEITGQVDAGGRNCSNNPETSGRYHTDWLNMMYPRLKLARNLLSDVGLIFISIDDSEVSNLRKICDEVLGEENFLAVIAWEKRYTRSNNAKRFYSLKDSIVVYRKSDKLEIIKEERTDKANEGYSNQDDDPRGPWATSSYVNPATKDNRPNLVYEIAAPDGRTVSHPTHAWKYSYDEYQRHAEEGRLWWGASGDAKFPRKKIYLNEAEGMVPIDLWSYKDSGTTDDGGTEVKSLFDGIAVFDNPKPTKLIQKMLGLSREDNDSTEVYLDFFAGSGSTGHAIFEKNIVDGKQRKFVLVQLPEPCNEKSEAYRVGYRKISDITKERLRRTGSSLRKENPNYIGDLGFKVFKLDSTNIKPWEMDFDLTEQDLEDQISNIKNDRTEEDVLYEVLLKYGLDLTLPITEHAIAGHKVFDIGMGALMICLSNNISLEVVEGIAKLKDELAPEIMRVVFKDAGFADDVVKTNAVQILKQAGIEDVRSL